MMTLALTWLKANWLPFGSGLALGLMLALLGQALRPHEAIKAQATANEGQEAKISTVSHISIKPSAPVASSNPVCPPCPQLPEITVDCGGKAEGHQAQALTATAEVGAAKNSLSLAIGGGSSITPAPLIEAGVLLSYGPYAAYYHYGVDGISRVGAYYKIWGR